MDPDLRREFDDLKRGRLHVIEAKVDNITRILDDPDFGIRTKLKDTEHRLRSVERWKAAIPLGLLMAAAAIVVEILRG